jgi:hypothetical protein
MNRINHKTNRPSEAGTALLIAIFALLLISVVAIALVVSSGTDTALAGNYRTSTTAYYAALAGLEEGRGRLLWRNPNFINNTFPNFVPSAGSPPLGLTQVLYILNPLGGETVDPTSANPQDYSNTTEYQTEFGWPLSGAAVQTTNSVWPVAGQPGPSYKWVRITVATEKSLGIDVDNSGLPYDSIFPLYYDPAHLSAGGTPQPGLIVTPSPPPTAQQALEITALAVLPNNTQKLLQYVVVPSSLNFTFPAALTLDGNSVSYTGPDSGSFFINGNDPTVGRSCATPPLPPSVAIGFTNASDAAAVTSGTSTHPANYLGPPTPSVGPVTLPANFMKPSTLDAVVRNITQSADLVLAGPIDRTTFPTTTSVTNPMTIVVNGDLDLTSWHNTGYGLLLVTGAFTYDPDVTWEGIVLVIGKGVFTAAHGGSGRIDGAMLVAQTRDPLGNLLPDPNLGSASVTFDPTTGGVGIYLNSCWINFALQPTTYKILSFREVPAG